MGLSWDYHGIIMGLSWDYHGIIMGLSWDYHGIVEGIVKWDNMACQIEWHGIHSMLLMVYTP
jgi:hypothetical protein